MAMVQIVKYQSVWNVVKHGGTVWVWLPGKPTALPVNFVQADEFAAVNLILGEGPAYFDPDNGMFSTGPEVPGE